MIRVLNSVVITTDDLERALSFYVDVVKLKPSQETSIDPPGLQALWGLEQPHRARSVLLKRRPNDDHGYIRLVQIENAGGRDIRQGTRPGDYGLFDVAFMVRDNEAKIGYAEKLGYTIHCWPQHYELGFVNGLPFSIKEGVINGPNSTKIVFIERFNAPDRFGTFDEETGFTEIADVVVMAKNLEKSMGFFRDVLGLPQRGLFAGLSGPAFEKIIGAKPGEKFDLAFLGVKQPEVSCVNFIHFHTQKGRQISGQGNLLNYGAAALSFATDDLEGTFQRVQEAKSRIVCPPRRVDFDGTGERLVFSCYGPHDILCEVYEDRAIA